MESGACPAYGTQKGSGKIFGKTLAHLRDPSFSPAANEYTIYAPEDGMQLPPVGGNAGTLGTAAAKVKGVRKQVKTQPNQTNPTQPNQTKPANEQKKIGAFISIFPNRLKAPHY